MEQSFFIDKAGNKEFHKKKFKKRGDKSGFKPQWKERKFQAESGNADPHITKGKFFSPANVNNYSENEITDQVENAKDALDDTTFHYFKRVAHQMQDEFPTKEDKEMFVENALDETEGKELKLSRNKITSYVVQSLLEQTSNTEKLKRFMNTLEPELSQLLFHPFGSHIIQCLLYAGLRILQTSTALDRDEDRQSIISWILDVGNQCFSMLDDILVDNFGCHVLRSLVEVLSGEMIDQAVVRSKKSYHLKKDSAKKKPLNSTGLKSSTDIDLPESFTDLLTKFVEHVKGAGDLKEWITDSRSSAYLQTLLLVLKKRHDSLCKKLQVVLIKQIFKSTGDVEDRLPDALSHDSSTPLVEHILEVAKEKQLIKIWMYSQPIIVQMAKHPLANYVAQKFISVITEKAMFEAVLNTLCPELESIMTAGQFCVWKCIAEACLRLGCQQGQFMKAIMEALHCYDPPENQKWVVPLLLYGTTLQKYEASLDEDGMPNLSINIHGSLLLQHILKFSKPIKVVSSILQLQPAHLRTITCDPKGSHVIDAFMQSPHVGEKNKNDFINHIKSEVCSLVCDKFGSRCMDNLWELASLNQKFSITEELMKQDSLLNTNYYAKYFASKCSLHHYKRRLTKWKEIAVQGGTKRLATIQDIDVWVPQKRQKTSR